MRFDDMLATVIAAAPQSAVLRRNRWRQIADIVAQKGAVIDPRLAARALAELVQERSAIPLADRIATAHAISKHASFAPLVALFSHDVPEVTRAVLERVTLAAEDWDILIPALGPVGRSVLRNRGDLPDSVRRSLSALAPADLTLASPPADASSAAPPRRVKAKKDNDQIRELVRRIEAFRDSRADALSSRANEPLGISSFQFLTGPDGAIRWVGGAPRGPLIGLSIAQPAQAALPGADAAAVGAYRNRAEIHDARITLPPLPGFAGSWRMSAVPIFDRVQGRFEGYRGTVRRARPGEDARNASYTDDSGNATAAASSGDAMRQLVHELRTPLNAISGFSQMIDGQMMGPASDRYRGLARRIAGDAGASLTMIDGLDLVLGSDDRENPDDEQCDIAEIARDAITELEDVAAEADVALVLRQVGDSAPVGLSASFANRLVLRSLSVLIKAGDAGSTINIVAAGAPDSPASVLAIAMPEPLDIISRTELLDPDYDNEDGPEPERLALAFTLRLLERSLENAGGRLLLRDGKLILSMPRYRRRRRAS